MPRAGLLTPRRLRELAVIVLIAAVLLAARAWLPLDGWGEVLRWSISAALTVGVVAWLVSLVIGTVREFRRGLAGED